MGKKFSKNKKSFKINKNCETPKEEYYFNDYNVQLISFDENNQTHKDKIDDFNKDNIIKICFKGESGVGCNSLVRALLGLPFDPKPPWVIGWRIHYLFLIINDKEYLIQLWNGPGQEHYRAYAKLFMKFSNIIFFVYDITSVNSFRELIDYHIYYVKEEMNNFLGCIIGNKRDLYEYNQIDDDRARKDAERYGFKFFLTSAKEPKEFIENFIKIIIEYIHNYKGECI